MAISMVPVRLDEGSLAVGVAELADRDRDLAAIVDRHGPPPLWARPAGFETLVAIILEQQVSLRSGAAALRRLRDAAAPATDEARAGDLAPTDVVRLGVDGARAAGLTRQKARYVTELAAAALDGRFDAGAIASADDAAARERLVALVGVGGWTADIYLLMALGRPDVWPLGDLALATALRRAKRLSAVPAPRDQLAIAEPWRPWRAVAARLLWHAYLAGDR